VENKTEIMQHVLEMQLISFLSKYTKLIYMGAFQCAFAFGGATN
jgi:hypothetical protein